MTIVVQMDKDKGIHETNGPPATRESIGAHCRACIEGYPKAHCRTGHIHAEFRYDMEAGFEWTYIYKRCDGCGFQEHEEVKEKLPPPGPMSGVIPETRAYPDELVDDLARQLADTFYQWEHGLEVTKESWPEFVEKDKWRNVAVTALNVFYVREGQ